MQLLSALDQITDPFWSALYVSLLIVAASAAVHAGRALMRRARRA